MARPLPQKTPLASAVCLAFLGGTIIATGGTVGRAAFVLSFFLLFLSRRWGFSVRHLVIFILSVGCGYIRAKLPALVLPFPPIFLSVLAHVHHALVAPFDRLFGADEASLAAGLTIGADVAFSSRLRAAMRASGTTHLVALSGYNISIVITNALALFSRVLSRRAASWLAGIGIILFTLTAGAQPSLVRAAHMGVLALVAYATGRMYHTQHAFLYTAAVMLVVEPTLLINIGAQLSFISLLGLVYIEPLLPFRAEMEGNGFMVKVRNILAEQVRTTVAAQAAVLPLLLHLFGSVNLLSIIANAIILPFVPFTMLLAIVTSLMGITMPSLVFLPAMFLHIFLTYILKVIYLFSRILIPLRWEMGAGDALIISFAAVVIIWYARILQRKEDRR